MKANRIVIAVLLGFASTIHATELLPQTCSQIRARINAVTGLAAVPSFDLLQEIGKHRNATSLQLKSIALLTGTSHLRH